MATQTHKTHIKTERCDCFEFGFYFICRVKQIPVPAPEKTVYFVPFVPLCGHSNCRF
jgi:hypothetical protein